MIDPFLPITQEKAAIFESFGLGFDTIKLILMAEPNNSSHTAFYGLLQFYILCPLNTKELCLQSSEMQ